MYVCIYVRMKVFIKYTEELLLFFFFCCKLPRQRLMFYDILTSAWRFHGVFFLDLLNTCSSYSSGCLAGWQTVLSTNFFFALVKIVSQSIPCARQYV